MSKRFKIKAPFSPAGQQPEAIQSLVENIEYGLANQTLLGVTGSGKTFTLAHVIERVQRPALILAPNKTLAAQLYGEMRAFFPDNAVEYFVSYYDYYQPEAYVPASDTFIEKDASINEQIEQLRLSATKAILERKDVIIVATVSAIYGLGDPSAYLSMILHLQVGDKIGQREILRKLAKMQYQRNDIEFSRACFRVRGDIIDIFPAESADKGIRVELFDDEIEGLSFFDPLTGKGIEKVPRLTVFPKSHYVTPKETILSMLDDIKKELRGRLNELNKANRLVESQRLEQRVNYDVEMMKELGYCSGIENYSRYLSGRDPGDPPPTLIDYLPLNALVIADESHVTLPQLGGMYKGDASRKANLVEYGFRLPSALDNRPLRFDEFDKIAPKQRIFVSATPGDYELNHSDEIVELVVRPTGLLDPPIEVRPIKNQVDDLLGEIKHCIQKNERVLVTTLTKRMSEDLTDYYLDSGIKVRYLHSDIETVERTQIIHDLRSGEFDVLIGINLLREGLDMPEVALVGILDADKEGFLRSGRGLIQTSGRAARNLEGRVIFYGDKITKAMAQAIDETKRRRTIQKAYNETHGITPIGIAKALHESLEMNEKITEEISPKEQYNSLTDKQLSKEIKRLDSEMLLAASNLEFEKATKLRDEVKQMREALLFRENI